MLIKLRERNETMTMTDAHGNTIFHPDTPTVRDLMGVLEKFDPATPVHIGAQPGVVESVTYEEHHSFPRVVID